jgi:hypothetical protein
MLDELCAVYRYLADFLREGSWVLVSYYVYPSSYGTVGISYVMNKSTSTWKILVGDSPRGPLKQRENPHLKPATNPKHNLLNHAGNGPRRRDPDGPSRRPS